MCAAHEPEHEYQDFIALKPQRWDMKNRPFPSSFAERKILKSSQITSLRSRLGGDVYAETNPLFSTLWHDVVLDLCSGRDLTVIILRRNAQEVLKSLLDLGWFHARDGNDWMVSAYSVNSLVRPLGPEREASPFDLVAGYLLNIELYAQRIRNRCQERGHQVIELYSGQLFGNTQMVMDLFAGCGLQSDPVKLEAIAATGKNKARTRNKGFDIPLDVCARELDQYLRRCVDNGVEVPDSFYR